jgi:hypothetical protein
MCFTAWKKIALCNTECLQINMYQHRLKIISFFVTIIARSPSLSVINGEQ